MIPSGLFCAVMCKILRVRGAIIVDRGAIEVQTLQTEVHMFALLASQKVPAGFVIKQEGLQATCFFDYLCVVKSNEYKPLKL